MTMHTGKCLEYIGWRRNLNEAAALALLALLLPLLHGCATGPTMVPEANRKPIDRKFVECRFGYVLETAVTGLTAPEAMTFVTEEGEYKGSLLVAESGQGLKNPRIYGWKPDRTFFNIYPRGTQIPSFGLLPPAYDIYGPIGGMIVAQGKIYVTHRDYRGEGVITAFGFDGSAQTIQAGLPAQGDYGMTDIVYSRTLGRLFFGVGAATNSGVVGLDNWQVGWVKPYQGFCDRPAANLKLNGFKFFTKNPIAGLFSGEDNVGTGPFQAFGKNDRLRISKAPNDKPTSAIYSVSPGGGDLRVWAHGIRYPRGLAFDAFGNLYATNDGMELRGSRPVMDDKDVLIKVYKDTWYGWPDFSADLVPISDERFSDKELLLRTGYPELSFLVDHTASDLSIPRPDTLLAAIFPSLSGAAKFDIIPPHTGLPEGQAVIALNGDRAPFATSGKPLNGPVGYKVVLVDIEHKTVENFVKNTEGIPASMLGRNVEALERPIDAKFGPDGRLYILDYGEMDMRGGHERVRNGGGRIFVLQPIASSGTSPTTGH